MYAGDLVQVSSRWFLGRAMCDAWTTLDLICCTSSILHLLAISLDRYWAVTQLDYIHHRSTRRIVAMIGASWTGSIIISAPPLFIDDPPNSDPDVTGECIINQNLTYTVFSTVGAFYLPFALMMIVYVKVFRAARARIRRKQFRTQLRSEMSALNRVSPEHSRVTTQQQPSATNGDVEVHQPELEVQASSQTGQRDELRTMVSGRGSVEELDNEPREEPLDHFPDSEKPILDSNARRLSHVTGQVSTDGRPGAHGCRSKSDVVGKQRWTAEDDDKMESRRPETRMERPLTLAVSCNDERPEFSVVVTNTSVDQQLDDISQVSIKLKENCTSELDLRRLNGRPAGLEITDMVAVPPVCTVTSPAVDQDATRSVNYDHRCYVEDATSEERQLCLPPKAADRLLTPTATPFRRSSWADLTRSLLPSAAALRLHFHVPSVAGRAAGRTARQIVEQRRERKAARTLAVITGTFVLCWLPFFIVALVMPFCGDRCHYPAPLISVIIWLGYANSLLNPVIYTVFNADFRSAFRKILFGKYRSRRR